MREQLRFICVGLSLLIVVGCGDVGTSPQAPAMRSLAAGAPAFDYAGGEPFGDQTTTFTVTSAGGSFAVAGLFNVYFPDNSICDPNLSSYGEGEWNTSCV